MANDRTFSPQPATMRLALVSPFIVGAGSALLLLVAALLAFGAADEFDYPGWAPSAGGVMFAVPALVGNGLFVRAVWRRTSTTFRVQFLRLALGCLPILGSISLTIAYALLVGDAASYRGSFNSITGAYDAMYTLDSFFWLTAMISVVFPGALAVLAKVLYLDALKPLGLAAPAGFDPVGEMLRRPAGR